MQHGLGWMRGRRLCAPHLIDCEVAHLALVKVRRSGVEAGVAIEAVRMLSRSELERHAFDPVEVFSLASRMQLSAYDAAYLWLAQRLGAPLATFDAQLGAAALRELRDS